MSTYTTNTKPESKFEDVPEEVLTDPTMRTALGMDPIPGMNTPVDDNKHTSMFDYILIFGMVAAGTGLLLKTLFKKRN